MDEKHTLKCMLKISPEFMTWAQTDHRFVYKSESMVQSTQDVRKMMNSHWFTGHWLRPWFEKNHFGLCSKRPLFVVRRKSWKNFVGRRPKPLQTKFPQLSDWQLQMDVLYQEVLDSVLWPDPFRVHMEKGGELDSPGNPGLPPQHCQ